MQQRGIEPRQVEYVLAESTITYPAPERRYLLYRAVIHRANVGGRPLKVYVRERTDPPYVLTAVWADEED